LSPPSDPGSPLHPQPGLDQLDALIAKVRGAGQPVTTRTVRMALPRGVDLTAYRVIQEALTNALRYAPGAPTEVVVDRDGDALVIEVTDDGAAAATGPPEGGITAGGVTAWGVAAGGVAAGGGSGLLGLAERLRIYHGTLEAGRRLGGGFQVRAHIPLEST
jgi:signal transduction histidine kinase